MDQSTTTEALPIIDKSWIRLSAIASCRASAENPGTIKGTQYPAVTKRINATIVKRPVTPRKNPQASRRNVLSSSVLKIGTKTCVSETLTTRKINCGNAPDAKNASVSIPTPRRVTTYQGIRMASTALQIASPASVRLSLIKLKCFLGTCKICLNDLRVASQRTLADEISYPTSPQNH